MRSPSDRGAALFTIASVGEARSGSTAAATLELMSTATKGKRGRKPLTYADAGVDIEAGDRLVAIAGAFALLQFRGRDASAPIAAPSSVEQLDSNPAPKAKATAN